MSPLLPSHTERRRYNDEGERWKGWDGGTSQEKRGWRLITEARRRLKPEKTGEMMSQSQGEQWRPWVHAASSLPLQASAQCVCCDEEQRGEHGNIWRLITSNMAGWLEIFRVIIISLSAAQCVLFSRRGGFLRLTQISLTEWKGFFSCIKAAFPPILISASLE